MIGHELTALYGLDHGQTLAIVLPPLLQIKRKQKKAKLLQMADCVFGIQGENDEETAHFVSKLFVHSLKKWRGKLIFQIMGLHKSLSSLQWIYLVQMFANH